MDWKIRLKLPKSFLGVQLKLVWKKREGKKVIGVYNKVGNKYVPFLDYDDIHDENFLYPELLALQQKYDLGNAYLFKTGKGFHVIFADLLSYDEWLEVLNASTCDKDYKRVPMVNGQKSWILRLTSKKNNKIIFHNVLWAPTKRETNQTVINLLARLDVPLEVLKNHEVVVEDGQELIFARYEA